MIRDALDDTFSALGVEDARRKAASLLTDAGIASAGHEARLLVERATGLDHTDLIRDPDCRLGPSAAAALARDCARRISGEPLSRIFGTRGFWGLDLGVFSNVLDPRADSEAVVKLALALAPVSAAPRVLDLGTGSGALLCALLSELPDAFGVGVDLSPDACRAARHNLGGCGLAARAVVIQGRWANALAGTFGIVVSNPPYIRSADLARLPDGVRLHDPALALDGGADGLEPYRAILAEAGRLLQPDSILVMEAGDGESESIAEIAQARGYLLAGTQADGSGRTRALAFRGTCAPETRIG